MCKSAAMLGALEGPSGQAAGSERRGEPTRGRTGARYRCTWFDSTATAHPGGCMTADNFRRAFRPKCEWVFRPRLESRGAGVRRRA